MKKKLLAIPFLALLISCCCWTSAFGQSEQYLHFDRVDDHVLLENASQYISNKSEMSMTGWFYTDQLAYGQGMMGLRNGVQGFYIIQLDNGIMECRFKNSAGDLFEYVAPQFSIVPQTWQHISWVYTGSEVQLYIDGDLKGSTAANGMITDSNISYAAGRSILSNLNFYFGGRIDELTLWDKALTETEIKDMMMNELQGDEANLQVYYKFNQGFPGEDNTSISKLFSVVGNGERDADLLNFALTGTTSNFGGMLDPGFQSISFAGISDKLTSEPPFMLNASASSNLPVSFEIVSGPATLSGNMLTLTGDQGTVKIRASQAGDGTFNPAEDVNISFEVLDPEKYVPEIDGKSPYADAVYYVPELSPVLLSATANIGFPNLFSVEGMTFEVNGETLEAKDYGNGFFSAWWNPPAYGDYTLTIKSPNNYTGVAEQMINFSVAAEVSGNSVELKAMDKELINTGRPSAEVEVELPCSVGAFNQLNAELVLECPTGGCGEWDRVANLEAQSYTGEWIKIVRYITPYGTPCNHAIDLTDFSSILHGKTKFRVSCVTFDNGYEYSLNLQYVKGKPDFKYSSVVKLWDDIYPFGDMANLQPTEVLNVEIPGDAETAKMKLLSTGHGWGENNTGNAAEFHEDTHHVWVDGQETFEQYNWNVCNPHPQGCSPQSGTWFNSRAGWCPGASADWFEYLMDDYLNKSSVELKYIFNEDYTDFCRSSNPNCTSATCPNCQDGFRPELHVSSSIVFYSNFYGLVNTKSPEVVEVNFEIFPNPSAGQFNFTLHEPLQRVNVKVFNTLGQIVHSFTKADLQASSYFLDLQDQAKGMYTLVLESEKGQTSKKLLIH